MDIRNVDSSDVMSRFDDLESRIERMEARIEALETILMDTQEKDGNRR